MFVTILATTSYAQMKVVTSGAVKVGVTGTAPAAGAQLHVEGGNTILEGGRLGINTTAPADLVHLVSPSGQQATMRFESVNRNATFQFQTGALEGGVQRWQMSMRRPSENQSLRFFHSPAASGAYTAIGTLSTAGDFSVIGDMNAGAFNVTSDKKAKTDVNEFNLGLDEVLQLNPISYYYNGLAGNRTDVEYVGIFAQELNKVAPILVNDFTHQTFGEDGEVASEETYLRINDTGIKYMLINAIKEQQALIEAQGEKIAQMEEVINTIGTSETINRTEVTLTNYDLAELNQNTPNPFNGTTSIAYIIPTDAQTSTINIYGQTGQLVKSLDIEHVGQGTLTVNAQDLPAGTYSYQLIVDGNKIDTQKMVLAR